MSLNNARRQTVQSKDSADRKDRSQSSADLKMLNQKLLEKSRQKSKGKKSTTQMNQEDQLFESLDEI
jgi:hypothetical protein